MSNNDHPRELGRKQVGIWVRVSTEDQARGESPLHHETRARSYAEAKGWEVATVYRLDGVSGKDVAKHPECLRMRADIASGRVTGLLFSKLARLARSAIHLLEFAEFFQKHGAHLISLAEQIDTTTPHGRAQYGMIATFAQWEREEISSRVAASVVVRAKMGKPLGGVAPFGYMWQDKKLLPNPETTPIRRLVHELFLEHRRKGTVARILNERGIRSATGKMWSDAAILRLLTDPTAKGLHRANYSRSPGKGLAWELKPESEWIYNEVPAIVSEELWDSCAAILAEQARTNKRPARRTRHLFSGLTYCQCGEKMYVPSNSPKYTCKACRNKIPVIDLEFVFRDQLRGFFLSSDEVRKQLEQANEGILTKEALLLSLETETEGVQAEMDKMMQLYLAGELRKEGFGERYQPLEDRRNQLHDEIPRLQGEIDYLRISLTSSDEVVREAQDLFARWADLTSEEKRHIVEQVIERITIGEGEVHIDALFRPVSPETVATTQTIPRDH